MVVEQAASYPSITSANLRGWAVLVCGDRAEAEREGLNYKNMLT